MPNILNGIKDEVRRVEQRVKKEAAKVEPSIEKEGRRIIDQAQAFVGENKLEREIRRVGHQIESLVQGAASTAVQTEPAPTGGSPALTTQSPGDIPLSPNYK